MPSALPPLPPVRSAVTIKEIRHRRHHNSDQETVPVGTEVQVYVSSENPSYYVKAMQDAAHLPSSFWADEISVPQ